MLGKNQSFWEESTNAPKPLISLYWDYQNIPDAKLAIQLQRFASSLGRVVNSKVYDNWERASKASKIDIFSLGFECINVSQSTKNAVDFELVIDCVGELVNAHSPDIFILVSGDGDYETLVRKLQGKGKKVIIFAQRGNVNKTLKKLANNFHFVDELPNLVGDKFLPQNTHVQPQTISYEDATKCLIEAIKTALQKSKCTRFETIDKLMRYNKRFPNYCGVSCIRKSDGTTFGKFKKFIAAVAAEGKVQVRTVGQLKELFLIKKDR